jgi:hypothetical protein
MGVAFVVYGVMCLWTRRSHDEHQFLDLIYRWYRSVSGDSVDYVLLMNGAVGILIGLAFVIFG